MERTVEKTVIFGNTEAAVLWTRDEFARSSNLSERKKRKIAQKFDGWKKNPEPVIALYHQIFNDCRDQVEHVMQSSHLPTFALEAFRDSDTYKKMIFWGVLYDLAHYKLTFNGKRYCDISEKDLYSYESVLFRVGYALRDSGLEYSKLNSVQKLDLLNRYHQYAFLHEVSKKRKR